MEIILNYNDRYMSPMGINDLIDYNKKLSSNPDHEKDYIKNLLLSGLDEHKNILINDKKYIYISKEVFEQLKKYIYKNLRKDINYFSITFGDLKFFFICGCGLGNRATYRNSFTKELIIEIFSIRKKYRKSKELAKKYMDILHHYSLDYQICNTFEGNYCITGLD